MPLEKLLRMFWQKHQPMPMSFTGTQYRSAIFCHGKSQRAVAEYTRETLAGDTPFASPLNLTAIEPAGPFYRAEEYHRARRTHARTPATRACSDALLLLLRGRAERFLEKQRYAFGGRLSS